MSCYYIESIEFPKERLSDIMEKIGRDWDIIASFRVKREGEWKEYLAPITDRGERYHNVKSRYLIEDLYSMDKINAITRKDRTNIINFLYQIL